MRRIFLLPLVFLTLPGAACDALHITTIPVDERPLPGDVAVGYREDAARPLVVGR